MEKIAIQLWKKNDIDEEIDTDRLYRLCKVNYRNYIKDLDNKLSAQKGIKVEFQTISEANHFFTKSESELNKCLNKYIKKETALY